MKKQQCRGLRRKCDNGKSLLANCILDDKTEMKTKKKKTKKEGGGEGEINEARDSAQGSKRVYQMEGERENVGDKILIGARGPMRKKKLTKAGRRYNVGKYR